MCLQENHQVTPLVFLQMTKWIFSVTKFANSLPKNPQDRGDNTYFPTEME